MAAGDCAKSSTMLSEWAARPEAAFWHNGPLGILVGTSALGGGMCKGPLGVDRGSVGPEDGDSETDITKAWSTDETEFEG